MDKRPKRSRSKDNPYYLSSDKENEIFIVTFLDNNIEIKQPVTKEVFEYLNGLELEDARQIQSNNMHIEQSKLMEITLYKRILDKPISLEDKIIKKIENEIVRKAIDSLSPLHRRRILLYYEYDLTLEEIANIEQCSFVAIKYSIDVALRKIKEYLEKK